MTKHFTVTGSGGGGKGGKPPAPGVESANTLRSTTIAQLVELLGEGEIVGLVLPNGTPVDETNIGKAIFLGETPVQNVDGTFNYPGLTATQRFGLPDQDHLNGVNQAETPISVGVQVRVSTGPLIHTIVDPLVDAARVIINIPALAYQNKETGDLTGASVHYQFHVRPYAGEWVLAVDANIVNQKCTSPYQRAHIIELPTGGAPWDIRMTRVTGDSPVIELQNETHWASYSEIIRGRFIYPDTALVSLSIDAASFGSSVPARAYRVRGLLTSVPTNYNPETREYTGIWDGTFKKAWHNNPAWVFYDLILNNRYGLGEFVDAATIDKWGLYTIGRYCDGLVPSGFKNAMNQDIMEPRFVFNAVINSRQEAYKVLQDITAAFRGMAYWSLGQVFAAADMPSDAVTALAPANVIDGVFKYSGTAMKARHSVALVSWNDPADHYRPAIEVVQNDEMLYRFGWRQIEVAPVGCTSRGQALRYGKWILDTEQHETETVTFGMSWDGYVLQNGVTLKPSDIVLISDPRRNTDGVRTGGRLAAGAPSAVILDEAFAPTSGASYNITVVLPDASIETRDIESFSEDNTTLVVATPFSMSPLPGAMFVIQGTDVTARRYKVMIVREKEPHIFEVSAIFNDATKYARVEQTVALTPIAYTRPSNIVKPPTGLSAIESAYFQNGVAHSRVTLSWTSPDDFLTADYSVSANTPRGYVNYGRTDMPSIDVLDAIAGEWTFYVSAISRTGVSSIVVPFELTVTGWEAIEGPLPTSLQVVGGGTNFPGTSPSIEWTNSFPADSVLFAVENVVRVYTIGGALLRTETVNQASYTYSLEKNQNDGGPYRNLEFTVTAKNAVGVESAVASIEVSNPSPSAVTPVVTATGPVITAVWNVADNDYHHSMVWFSNVSGFNPNAVDPVYEGPDTSFSTMVTQPGLYYVRVAAYDKFGKSGLNIGPQVVVTCTGLDIAAFNTQLQDRVTTQLKVVSDSIQNTQSLIASVAAEQDAANFMDKKNSKVLLKSRVDSINNTIADLTLDVETQFVLQNLAISTAQSAAQTYADSAIAAYNVTVVATYGTLVNLATAKSEAISHAESYSDQSIATYDQAVQALYATITNVATAKTEAISQAQSSADTALAAYQLVVNAQLNGTPAAVTISIASPAVVTWADHGFFAGQGVKFTTTGALPTGLIAGVFYYIIYDGLTSGSFRVSAEVEGDPIVTSGSQSGVHTGTPQGFAAGITQSATAIADVSGRVAGQWLVTLDANGYVSGLQAYNDGTTANMTIIADTFQVASPANVDGATATVTMTIATPCVVSWASHGFSAGQRVKFTGGTFPTGITAGAWYYVISAGLTAGTFRISATEGGAAINTSGSQSGTHTGTASGGGLPKPMFTIANINGVPQLVMDGLMIADGEITAEKMNVAELTAITASLGDAVVTGKLTSPDGGMIIDFTNGQLIFTDGTP